MTTRQYKQLKGVKKENLRDNMSTLELVLNMLAEATTTEISKATEPQTFEENRQVALARWSHCWKYSQRNRSGYRKTCHYKEECG